MNKSQKILLSSCLSFILSQWPSNLYEHLSLSNVSYLITVITVNVVNVVTPLYGSWRLNLSMQLWFMGFPFGSDFVVYSSAKMTNFTWRVRILHTIFCFINPGFCFYTWQMGSLLAGTHEDEWRQPCTLKTLVWSFIDSWRHQRFGTTAQKGTRKVRDLGYSLWSQHQGRQLHVFFQAKLQWTE